MTYFYFTHFSFYRQLFHSIISLNFTRLLIKYIIGMPIPITVSSPIAHVNHVKKNGNPNARCSSKAMMNIVKEKTSVFTIMRQIVPFTYFMMPNIKSIVMTDCPTPKTKSYQPSGEYKFVMSTPSAMPQKYFLLNTIRWLNNSGTLNWMAPNAIG